MTAKRSRSIKSDHTTAPTARAGRRDQDSTSREPIHQRPNKESGATSRPGLQHHRRTRSWSGARAALQDTPQTSITSTENESTGTGERDEIKHSPHTSQNRGSTALLPLGLNRNVPLVGQGEDHQTHTTEPEMVATATAATQTRQDHMENDADEEAVVPTVRVRLVTSLRLPPYKSVRAQVEVDPGDLPPGPWMLQYRSDAEETLGICGEDVVIDPGGKQVSEVLLSNHSGFTCHLDAEEFLGTAVPAEVVNPPSPDAVGTFAITTVTRQQADLEEESRRKKLRESLEEPDLPRPEKDALLEFIGSYHHVFSLEDGERGETDLVQMEINTGDAAPRKQPPRRVPFTLRQEILDKMQREGVIEPSRSPWASPVVLVKKRDGSHRFCVDYRGLNAVTRADSYPLPRIEDLLDQLGKSTYFSSIDLASGFWQIRMHPDSQEKTAFTTLQGLFEFRVMPFGLTNAPAVFQRLMQQVVTPLNPRAGPDFVSVYIDDILVFSSNLEKHLEHLRIVFKKLAEVGLKLKPSKCRFAQKELEYLGHVVSRDGLKTSPRLVEAVQCFPVPRSVKSVRSFLGLLPEIHPQLCQDSSPITSSDLQERMLHLVTRLPGSLPGAEGAAHHTSGVGIPKLRGGFRTRDRCLYRRHRSCTGTVPR